ncbi:hypothetical protein METSCH_A12310 [Metschnikowia aff. pulcherrima]|uniref:Stress response protein NST1 n=1 Tax=Metschnikowia aff. pulcherrima TaxID=2163413 RepID=A0A4P6XKB7_9ASCO|nr:hypothetical protein METSCH_A12310 [Metschnikowia aff. pulcherrima]
MEEHIDGKHLIAGTNCYFNYGEDGEKRQTQLSGLPPRLAPQLTGTLDSRMSAKKKKKKRKNSGKSAGEAVSTASGAAENGTASKPKFTVGDVTFVDPDAEYPESRVIKVGPNGDLIVESLEDEFPREDETITTTKMVPPVPTIPAKLAHKILGFDEEQRAFWDGMSTEAQKQIFTIDGDAITESMRQQQKELASRNIQADSGSSHDHLWTQNSKCYCSRCERNDLHIVNIIDEGFDNYMEELLDGLWEQFELQYHDLKPESKFIDVASAENVLHDKYIEAQNVQRFAEIKEIQTAGANAGEMFSTVRNLELFYYMEHILIPMMEREFASLKNTTELTTEEKRGQVDTLSCVHQILRLIQSMNDRTRLLRISKGVGVKPLSPKEFQKMVVSDNLIDCLHSFLKEGLPGIPKAIEFVKILSSIGSAKERHFPDVTEQMSKFADMFQNNNGKSFVDVVAKLKASEEAMHEEEEEEPELDHYALKNPFSHCKCDFHNQLSKQFESARSQVMNEELDTHELGIDEDDFDDEHDCEKKHIHDHDEDEDEYDDPLDDPETDEEEAEERRFKELRGFFFMEARKVIVRRFQDSYKKRVSEDRTKKFIEELEAEENAKKERELKKMQQREKQREKKRLQQLEKEEKRKQKEAEELEKAALVKKKRDELRAEQMRREDELKLKKEKEKMKKIEALKLKEQLELKRKEELMERQRQIEQEEKKKQEMQAQKEKQEQEEREEQRRLQELREKQALKEKQEREAEQELKKSQEREAKQKLKERQEHEAQQELKERREREAKRELKERQKREAKQLEERQEREANQVLKNKQRIRIESEQQEGKTRIESKNKALKHVTATQSPSKDKLTETQPIPDNKKKVNEKVVAHDNLKAHEKEKSLKEYLMPGEKKELSGMFSSAAPEASIETAATKAPFELQKDLETKSQAVVSPPNAPENHNQELDANTSFLAPKNHLLELLYHARPRTVSTTSGDSLDFFNDQVTASRMGTGYSPSKNPALVYQPDTWNPSNAGTYQGESVISPNLERPQFLNGAAGSSNTWGLKNTQDVFNQQSVASPLMSNLPASTVWSPNYASRGNSIWGTSALGNAEQQTPSLWGPHSQGDILSPKNNKDAIQSAAFKAIQDVRGTKDVSREVSSAMSIFQAAKTFLNDPALKMSEFLQALHSSAKYHFDIIYDDFGSVTDIQATIQPERIFGTTSIANRSPSPQQTHVPHLFQTQPPFSQPDHGPKFLAFAQNPLPLSQPLGQPVYQPGLGQDPFQLPNGAFQPSMPVNPQFSLTPGAPGQHVHGPENPPFQLGPIHASSENVSQFDSKISETMQGSLNQLGIPQVRNTIW